MPVSGAMNLKLIDPVLARYAGADRSQLIPALLDAQRVYGHLPEPVVAAIGGALGVPLAEIHGVIHFYSMLYDQSAGRTFVRVCRGPCCVLRGSEAVLQAACKHFGVRPGQPTADGRFVVEEVPCLCLCDHAPAALVGDMPVGPIDPRVPASWVEAPVEAPLGNVDGNPRWLTSRCGVIPPTDLGAFVANQGFQGLRRALKEMQPGEVIAEIKASGLVGRGGAAFPTGLKWEMAAGAEAAEKYVVCNGDESEPGTFKDRILMEGDPFALLEGMVVASYATGAHKGFLYVRGEYPRAQGVLQQAIRVARENGYLGDDILGSGHRFDVELRSGAGAYVCGEETALFESIEGRRGHPRSKPPYPTTHGLFGKPTAINNVETLCAAAWIVAHGAKAYRSVGTRYSPGAKLFCLSGDVQMPGVYEVPFGTTLGSLLNMAGGVQGNLQSMMLGGAAGAFAGPEDLGLSLSFEGSRALGLPLGSGVVMVFNQERDLRQVLLSLAWFFAHESCGKCFPCRMGSQRQLEFMEKLVNGGISKMELEALRDVQSAMTDASLCGLGMTAGTAIASALQRWPGLLSKA